MKKKATKATKKPRPKTVTLKQWRLLYPASGWLSAATFRTKRSAKIGEAAWCAPYCAARVTITYEVR